MGKINLSYIGGVVWIEMGTQDKKRQGLGKDLELISLEKSRLAIVCHLQLEIACHKGNTYNYDWEFPFSVTLYITGGKFQDGLKTVKK